MSVSRDAVSTDDMALDLAGLIKTIGASLRWLLPLVLIVAGSVFVVLQLVPSKYMGEARVLIESADARYPGTTRGVEGERAVLDNEGVASQVQLLMSADLARRVAKRLDLSAVPEFEAAGSGSLLGDALAVLGLGSNMTRSSAEEKVLKHYFKNLDVYTLEGSRVIAVEYSAQDPELAAAVANTILDEYISLQKSAKRETTEIASTALEPQIAQLQREVQAARKAVEDFRARADLLVGANDLTLNQAQLAEISSEYSAAQANKAEAQAKADLIRELLNSGGSLETATDVLNSLLIQRLRERQVAIQSNIAELSITLLPNHPQLRALQSQLAGYNKQIRAEARKVLIGLENDSKVSNQQAAALENRLQELKVSAARSSADQVRLSELDREASAKARQLDSLLNSFREADTRLRAQALPADARIISRSSVPNEPYAPKVFVITIISALATFILGCTFVIMREFLSGNVLYPVDYQSEAVRAPETVSMPEGNWNGGSSGHRFSMSGSFSGLDQSRGDPQEMRSSQVEEEEDFDDAFAHKPTPRRGGRTREDDDRDMSPDWYPEDAEVAFEKQLGDLERARSTAAPVEGCLVVLSVDSADHSHRLGFDLARDAAAAGQKTLFLEVFPENEDLDASPGFSDLVLGNVAFGKAIYRDANSSAHIIEAGRMRLLDKTVDGERFQTVLDAISSTYETIIIDLGTIDGTLASARILGLADRILVAAAGEHYGKELDSAANLLARNTGVDVEVVPAQQDKSKAKSGRNGKHKHKGRGWAA